MSSGKRAVGVPIPIFPWDSTMGEFPIVVELVNSGIVLVVPLPVIVCALAPRAARPNTSSKAPIRFIMPPS
jgi:hypothetical protein